MAPVRPRWVVLAAGALVVVAIVVWFAAQHRTDALHRADSRIRSGAGFDTGPAAATITARLALSLLAEGRRCSGPGRRPSASCQQLIMAGGYLEEVAFQLRTCTLPAVFDARQSASGYLSAVERFRRTPGQPAPTVPPLPSC